MKKSNCMNVVIKPIVGYSDYIVMARSYGVLRPEVGKIYVCLRNYSVKQIAPKVNCCGRDCSGKCHSDYAGFRANRG